VKLLTTLVILSFSLHALATTTTLSGISGTSSVVQPTTTTTTFWTVYGGIQGDNASSVSGCSTSGTCNTCDGTAITGDLVPCNFNGVFGDTVMTFSATTDSTVAGYWLLCNSTSPIKTTSTTDKNTLLSLTWSELCTNGGGGTASSNCTSALQTSTLYFGYNTDCNALSSATDKISIQFNARRVDRTVASTYVSCTESGGSGDSGACFFSLFPGDKKAYIDKFGADATFPTPANSTSAITYSSVEFFFLEGDVGQDNQTFSNITSNTIGSSNLMSTSELDVSGDSLSGSYISGLDNNARYCFKMASKDTAGNIDKFTPASVCTSDPCDNVCMSPSEVVGILSDKSCFIATAAFGSDMDQHVQMLRNFRNQFMVPFWIGRKMVKAYYTISPSIAHWIAKHETARTAVRGMLWPILGWAELALRFGWMVVLAPFLTLALGFLVLRKWRLTRT
jgi:hypothetical protein